MTESLSAAGPPGLFAAGWAAKSGLRVLVLEKRERPARKILVTGKGRCNVTNHCSPQEFIAAVRRNPRFLMSAIYAMTPQDTMACFEELGVALKTERGNRVFPVSDRAMDIADALVRFARQGGVQIKQATVSELIQRDDAVVGVKTEAGEEFFAPLTILATGGKSYPGHRQRWQRLRLGGCRGTHYYSAAALVGAHHLREYGQAVYHADGAFAAQCNAEPHPKEKRQGDIQRAGRDACSPILASAGRWP